MQPYGKFKKRILNIGEAPGAEEDKKGRQWQNKVGKMLQRTYQDLGIDLFDDCLNINSINCHPTDKGGKNRKPAPLEISCCRNKVIDVIETYKPNVIILHGGSAIESIIGHRWKKDLGGITKWRGWCIPDRDFNTWICPVFHPSYVERGEEEIETIWKQDLKRALSMTDILFPIYTNDTNKIVILDEQEDVEAYTNALKDFYIRSKKNNLLYLDLETTGIKPHAKGHRIMCISLCDSPDKAYTFTIPKEKHNKLLLNGILKSDAPKGAHNLKFEQNWIREHLGFEVNNWRIDTMLMAHLLDNRQGITSLKQQVYFRFGVVDYDSDIRQYIEAKEKGGNSFNEIVKAFESKQVKKKIMVYCGLDSLYGYNLAMIQLKESGYAF
jgi:DNA polymerase